MQGYSWDDFRYLLAVYRAGTLTAAARILGVNETTVARRLKALERGLSVSLFLRDASGRYQATDVARLLVDHAESIEHQSLVIEEAVGLASKKLAGTVRISSVPIVVNRILVPHLRGLCDRYPFLTLELLPESRNVDLTRREADLAVRLARPEAGGQTIHARKIGMLEYSVFAPAREATPVHWIGYDDDHSHLPQARWLRSMKEAELGILRVADAETALEAVASGLGVAFLPRMVGINDPRLREIGEHPRSSGHARPVWLLSHVDQKVRASVSVVKDWLAALPWDDVRL